MSRASAEGIGLMRRIGVAVVAAPLLGALAWSVLWYVFHGASAFDALTTPWAAPLAWATWPAGQPVDPRLLWAGGGAALLVAATLVAIAAPLAPAIHGDARFARAREIRRMGLLAPTGILLGRTRSPFPSFLRHGGPLHVLVTAPTRSGKGVGIVTPNLLSWPGSAVVLDVKDENFQTTSGYRAEHGQRVFRFAPGDADGRTHRFNPLDAVRRARSRRIGDLQAIAHLLTAEGLGDTSMWNQEARSLFVGVCLYILDTPGLPLTFGQVARVLQTNADLGQAFKEEIAKRGDALDPACVNILANFANKAPKEQSGVKSTLTGALELWNDPLIDAATAASDFGLEDLRREPTTIYVSVTLDQLERLAFLLNLFFQQLVGVTARRMPGTDEPHELLVLIDEFASLGRMDLLVDKMPFLAGFRCRLLLVIQGLAQLDRLYGVSGRELVLANAGLQLFFASNDDQTSTYVSERLGTYTHAQKSRSRSRPLMGGHGGSVTTSVHLHARALMKREEVRQLGRRREIIFVEGSRPVLASKIVYYSDATFKARLRSPVRLGPIEVPVHAPFRFGSAPAADTAEPPATTELSRTELGDVLALARKMPSLARAPRSGVGEPPPPPEADAGAAAPPEAEFAAMLLAKVRKAKQEPKPASQPAGSSPAPASAQTNK